MSAAEVLDRMRAEKQKKPNGIVADPENFYVKMLFSPARRRQLAFYLVMAFAAITTLIYQHQSSRNSWGFIALPVIFIGLTITLIPPTEDWLYKPWQTKPRQCERHQIERF